MIHIGNVVPAAPWSYSWPNRSSSGPFEASCGLSSAPYNCFVGFMTEKGWRLVRDYLESAEELLQGAVRLDPEFASQYQSPTYLAGVGAVDSAIGNLRSEISALSYFARRELREKEAQMRELQVAKEKARVLEQRQPLSLKVFVPGALRMDEECSFTVHIPDLWVDMLFDSMFDAWFYVSLLESSDKCLRAARGSLDLNHQAASQQLALAINRVLAG